MAKRPSKFTHDQAILGYCLLGGLPAVAFSMVWLWSTPHEADVRATVALVVIACWLGFAFAVQERVIRPLQTMSNLLMALREGDFSFRARGAKRRDPLGDVLAEINGLGEILQTQRRGALEATALLSTVIREIDVAIFAFDSEGVLRLVNPAGQSLLGQPGERLLGREAKAIGLGECLEGKADRILGPSELPRAYGRWSMRRTTFREEGRPHHLIVFGDMSRPLREEQLKAWQRLVRVLGHELNNSLAPIKSIAATLGSSIERLPRGPRASSGSCRATPGSRSCRRRRRLPATFPPCCGARWRSSTALSSSSRRARRSSSWSTGPRLSTRSSTSSRMRSRRRWNRRRPR
jgi:PAS domain S-box-containing protein